MKKICVALAVLLATSILCACSERNDTYAKVFAEAASLNEHSNFGEYELLGEASQEDPEEYPAGEPERFSVFGNDGDFLLYRTYSPYPYDSGILRSTHVVIYSREYHVYGIKIGDTLEEGFQRLLELGYTEIEESYYVIATQKENIYIDIFADSKTLLISQINITVYDPFIPDSESQSQADYSFHRDEVYALAKELNDNSDFGGFALTDAVPANLRSEFGYVPFVTDLFSIENIEATYREFDYDGRLMGILLKSGEYNLLGVKVGDGVEESGAKLAEFGYEFSGDSDSGYKNEYCFFYGKGEYARSSVRLITAHGGTKIISIYVGLSDNYERELLGAY